MNTNIKKWPVGSPVHDDRRFVVSNSNMSDVNMQHLLAISLLNSKLNFDAAHNMKRMKNRKVLELKKRIEPVASAELTIARPARQCIIAIATRDGRQLQHHTYAVRETADNPMTRAEVAENPPAHLQFPGQRPGSLA